MYVVRNRVDKTKFWKSGLGWAKREEANHFTEHDTERLPLPPAGEWVEVPPLMIKDTA